MCFQEAEEAAAAKAAKLEAHAAARAAQAAAAADAIEAENNMQNMAKSPSDFSCHSYELFVGQEKGNDDNNKEKMSIRSEGLESVSEMHQRPTAPSAIASGTTSAAKVRKVSAVSIRECFCTFYIRKPSFLSISLICHTIPTTNHNNNSRVNMH